MKLKAYMFVKKILTAGLFTFLIATITPLTTFAAGFNLSSFFTSYWERFFGVARTSAQPTPTPFLHTPTATPTATETPTPTPSPTPTPVNISAYLLGEINNYRKSQGLYEVTSDPHTCKFARLRAEEISKDFGHEGFNKHANEGNSPYPSFSKMTENIAMGGNYKKIIEGWIKSPGHAENMRADTPFVCVAKYGSYYAYEGWRP